MPTNRPWRLACPHRKGPQPPPPAQAGRQHIMHRASPQHHEVLGPAGGKLPAFAAQVQEQARPKSRPQAQQGHGAALPRHRARRRAAGTDRFAEGQEDLAPEDVEEVGRSGAVHNNPVAVVELTHVKVVQFLPRRVQFKGFQETQGASWPHSSSSGGESSTQPPLPPLPLQSTWTPTETRERLQVCAPALRWPATPPPPAAFGPTSALHRAAAPGVVEVQPPSRNPPAAARAQGIPHLLLLAPQPPLRP